MEEGLDPPCLELGCDPEHRLLAWLTRKANKNGIILLGRDKMYYRAEHDTGAKAASFQHLEDAGYIEKLSVGDSHRYRVLVFCTCPGEDPLTSYPALRRELMLAHSAGMSDPRVGWLDVSLVSGATSVGVKSESVQKSVTTTYLAKYFFPQVVKQTGIQINVLLTNGAALTTHLNRWKTQGVDLLTMQLMMEEFAKHPEWCRRSKRPPWQVFVSRRGELAAIVLQRQRRDPANRRLNPGQGRDYWFGRHTSRAVSPA